MNNMLLGCGVLQTDYYPTDQIAHYPLIGSADDFVNSYDGTESGSYTYDMTDRQSAVINSNKYFLSGITHSGVMTYSIWFKHGTDAYQTLFCFTHGLYEGNYIRVDGNGTIYYIKRSGTYISYSSNSADGNWHNMVVVREIVSGGNDITSIYYDNALILVDTQDIEIGQVNVGLYVYESGTLYPYNGHLYNMKVFDRKLSTNEIDALYSYDLNNLVFTQENNLTSFYPLRRNGYANTWREEDLSISNGTFANNAFTPNSESDTIEVALTDYPLYANVFTILFWFKWNGVISGGATYLNLFHSGDIAIEFKEPSANEMYIALLNGGTLSQYHKKFTNADLPEASDDNWHLMAIRHQASSNSLDITIDTVDKNSIGTDSSGATFDNVGANIKLGYLSSSITTSDSYSFRGVRIYNTYISNSDIETIYNNEAIYNGGL